MSNVTQAYNCIVYINGQKQSEKLYLDHKDAQAVRDELQGRNTFDAQAYRVVIEPFNIIND